MFYINKFHLHLGDFNLKWSSSSSSSSNPLIYLYILETFVVKNAFNRYLFKSDMKSQHKYY